MAQIPNSELIRCAEITANRQRQREIKRLAEAYGQERRSVQRYVNQRRAALRELLDAGVVVRKQPHHDREPLFEEQWRTYERFIGRDHNRPLPEPPPPTNTGRRVVCVLADTHGHPLPQVVEAVLDDAPDVIAVAGDVLDCFAFSRWQKDRLEPIELELARVTAMVEAMAATTPRVLLLAGNHDKRRERYFMEKVDPWAMGELKDPPLKLLAECYQNVEYTETVHDYHTPTGLTLPAQFEQSFFAALGDLVVAHPEISRKHAGASARAFAEQFNAWCGALGVKAPRVIAVGHCHRWAVVPGMFGQTLVELGYSGMPSALQYSMDAAKLPPMPPEPGYLYVVQELDGDDWRCDLRTLRYVRV
jgi:predicted phosphodiesterase